MFRSWNSLWTLAAVRWLAHQALSSGRHELSSFSSFLGLCLRRVVWLGRSWLAHQASSLSWQRWTSQLFKLFGLCQRWVVWLGSQLLFGLWQSWVHWFGPSFSRYALWQGWVHWACLAWGQALSWSGWTLVNFFSTVALDYLDFLFRCVGVWN